MRNLPPQARGEADLTPQSDQYSLGSVLYEMLTGRLPFENDSTAEAVADVLKSDPPRPRSIHRGIPRSVERVCLRAMAKRPADRFASTEGFAAALKTAERHANRQSKRVLAGIALLCVVLLVIVIVKNGDKSGEADNLPASSSAERHAASKGETSPRVTEPQDAAQQRNEPQAEAGLVIKPELEEFRGNWS